MGAGPLAAGPARGSWQVLATGATPPGAPPLPRSTGVSLAMPRSSSQDSGPPDFSRAWERERPSQSQVQVHPPQSALPMQTGNLLVIDVPTCIRQRQDR